MLDDAVLLENLVEHVQRPSAIDHKVFRDDFEPVDHRLLFENVVVMRDTQADAYSVIGEAVKAISGHDDQMS